MNQVATQYACLKTELQNFASKTLQNDFVVSDILKNSNFVTFLCKFREIFEKFRLLEDVKVSTANQRVMMLFVG